MYPKLTPNYSWCSQYWLWPPKSSCLNLPSNGMMHMHHHGWLFLGCSHPMVLVLIFILNRWYEMIFHTFQPLVSFLWSTYWTLSILKLSIFICPLDVFAHYKFYLLILSVIKFKNYSHVKILLLLWWFCIIHHRILNIVIVYYIYFLFVFYF